jgi:AcrR family transcriptional regulator
MSLTTASPKLDPRVKRTRQFLQQALMELLAHQSFQSITVQDITEKAELNRATFYAHFEDKYALMNYHVRQMFQEALHKKLPPDASLTPDNLRLLILTVCKYLQGFVGSCSPSSINSDHALIFAQVQASVEEVLTEWLQMESTPRSTPPDVLTMVMSWAIFGSIFQWSRQKDPRTPAEFSEQILEIMNATLWING